MDKEELFNDGVNLLETLLKKFIKEENIPENESYQYFINFPDSYHHVDFLDFDIGKFLICFPVYFSADGEKAEYHGMLFVLLEDNLKIIRYEGVSEEVKSSGRLVIKKLLDLKFERNHEMVESLAKLYYIAKSLNRHESGSEVYKKAYDLYMAEIDNFTSKVKEYESKKTEDKSVSNISGNVTETTLESSVSYTEINEKIKKMEDNTIIIPRNNFKNISNKYGQLDLSNEQIQKLIEIHHQKFLKNQFKNVKEYKTINDSIEKISNEKIDSTDEIPKDIIPEELSENMEISNQVSFDNTLLEDKDKEKKTINLEEKIDELIKRLNAGTSEKKPYDFRWDETALLNYADDDSLKIAYQMIERGQISLERENNSVCISSYLDSFCNQNMPNELFLKKANADRDFFKTPTKFTWKYTMGEPLDATTCYQCKYQSCPKYLAAYILYLKNQGKLKEKLIEREKFRNENNISNGFFLFEWENKNGLKKIDDKSFEFANELVNREYVRVDRCLKNNKIKIRSLSLCRDLQLSNTDINKHKNSRDWSNPTTIKRNINSEPDLFCDSYTCRLPSCILEVAGYIYYLRKSGQEHKIQEDRKYYSSHKEEIEIEIKERVNKKLEFLNSKKEEKIQDFKETYDGKIENLNLAINSIMESDRTNFHCIVAGDDEEEKDSFIEKIVELLKNENRIQDIRKISA